MCKFARFVARAGVSQTQLAALVGAARKAAVYQWEARKRTPFVLRQHPLLVLAKNRRAPPTSDGANVSGFAPGWRDL